MIMISWLTSNILSGNRFKKLLVYLVLNYIQAFLELIDYMVPKDDKLIVFGSSGGEFCSGSSKTLYNHIKTEHPEYKSFFYMPFRKDLRFMARLKYIFVFASIFFRAKFLVSTHPPTDFFPFISWSTKKIFINTWHGIPIKRMFFTDNTISKIELIGIIDLNRKTSALIVSSRLEALLMRLCFRIDPTKIFCTGHPRNDTLLKKHSVRLLSTILPDLPVYQKVILYCPTYRRGRYVQFFPFNDFDSRHFEKFLEDNKIIVLLRHHPYDKGTINFSSTRIIPFDSGICGEINDILPEVDILITDYSSVYFDYLLLDRPCIFIPYDLNKYKRDVGFLLDYDTIAAGPKVSTYKEFIAAIKGCMEVKDSYSDRRSKLKTIFHEYQKENSSEQVFILMNSLLRKKRSKI
jgi:CDP-glycerol glycerophosphotransferase